MPCCRKLSLINRFNRFLDTAVLIFFADTAKPRRACFNPFSLARMRKWRSDDRVFVSKTRLKSEGLINRCCFVKQPFTYYAVNRFRPFARLDFITRRPPLVLIRERNPCRRFLFNLLGWYVCFMVIAWLHCQYVLGLKGLDILLSLSSYCQFNTVFFSNYCV